MRVEYVYPIGRYGPGTGFVARLRFAALRQDAIVEDVDLPAARGLDRALLQKLAARYWIDRKQNVLVIGPAGVGKS
jgi:DNA replication protein DnaC